MRKSAQNIHRFAQRQGGHITRAQLEQAGLARRTVADWVAAGKLIRVHRGVYALGYRPRNPIDRAHAALLAAGPRSALTGAAALVLWGIWRHWPRDIEVLVKGDRRPSGLIVHRSATLTRADIRLVHGLRVTSPARTMLDMARRLGDERLTRAVNDLRLRDLLALSDLADVIERNPTHPGRTRLRPHLEIAQPEPTRSWLEERFLPLLRSQGLPTPRINVHVAGHRVDALFPDHELVVELDGWGSHGTRTAFVADRRQDLDILLATGMPTVRLVSEDVDGATIARLGRLLAARRRAPAIP